MFIKISNYWQNGQLKCQYVNNKIPFLIIGPVKEERISLNPFIAVYHDIITESQANRLKDYKEVNFNGIIKMGDFGTSEKT